MDKNFESSNKFELVYDTSRNPGIQERFKIPKQCKKASATNPVTPLYSSKIVEASQLETKGKSRFYRNCSSGSPTPKHLQVSEFMIESELVPVRTRGSQIFSQEREIFGNHGEEFIELFGNEGPQYFRIVENNKIAGIDFESARTTSQVENDCQTDESQIELVVDKFRREILTWLDEKEREREVT
jgi:hypothetical protein